MVTHVYKVARRRWDDAILSYHLMLTITAPLNGWDEITFTSRLGGGQVERAGLRSRP